MMNRQATAVRPQRVWQPLVAILVVILANIAGTTVAGAAVAVPSATVSGTVVWVGGPDSRATLHVGACPEDEPAPLCPSLTITSVAADGSYSLPLKLRPTPTTWVLRAFVVSAGGQYVLGPPVRVTVPRSPRAPVALSVTARVVGMSVLDGHGDPFPVGTAGILVCPTATGFCTVAHADANGDAALAVDPDTEYSVSGYAWNTGWPNAWIAPDGTAWSFSTNSVTALGRDLVDGTAFVVAQPPSAVHLRVVDGFGNPFPVGTAGILACPTATGACFTAPADANGDAALAVDPDTEYQVGGYAVNTGWPNAWIGPDGTAWSFSTEAVTALGRDLVDGTVYVVSPT